MYEAEASFWLDGTLHQTWARVGVRPRFQSQFAAVFNAQTVLDFLKLLVRRTRRKVFLVIDNSPCHNLDADGRAWLVANRRRIERFRLPPCSPEFHPIEGVWKQTKKRTTHNTFFRTTDLSPSRFLHLGGFPDQAKTG